MQSINASNELNMSDPDDEEPGTNTPREIISTEEIRSMINNLDNHEKQTPYAIRE
jgi:hypothetical protein